MYQSARILGGQSIAKSKSYSWILLTMAWGWWTGISVWGNFSWEKWYQDQQFWFSSLFSRAHFVTQISPFQLGLKECHFGFPQLWAVNQLTLSMHFIYTSTRTPLVTVHIHKVKWITAHNCGKPKWHSFMPSLGWKGKIWGLNIFSQKCALENKLLNQNCWSWCHFFSGEVPSNTWYHFLHPHIVGSMLFHFFYGPPCICIQ